MTETVLEIGVLNIKATPHPIGIYPKLLKKVSNTPVQIHGDDYFTVRPPERTDSGFYEGRFWVWTDVDPNKPAINKRRLEELSHADAEQSLRTDIGLNLRVFYYVLRERDHLIFFEYRNEAGNHLAPSRLVKALNKLFIRRRSDIVVDINIVPEEDALDRILAIPILTLLEIDVKKPNGDDNSDSFAEVMKELEEEGTKEKFTRLRSASPKKGITPNALTLKYAEVAAANGNVRGKGKGKKRGEKFDLSTEKYPIIFRITLDATATTKRAILRLAKDATVGRKQKNRPPN